MVRYVERLNLMLETNLIDTSINKKAVLFGEKMMDLYQCDWSMDTVDMFASHMAMAIKRVRLDEAHQNADESFEKELVNCKEIVATVSREFRLLMEPYEVTHAECLMASMYIKMITGEDAK